MDFRQSRSVLLCVCFLSYSILVVFGSDKVRIRDVEVLTLREGRMTTGRRNSPVSQLKCVGGSAGCSTFVPQVVQCYNRGWDGYDAQWECKTDMDNKYRFGRIDVSCEGYDHPDDPYILRGSCGLEYTIELTEEGRVKQGSSDYHGWNDYQDGNRRRYKNSSGFGDLVMFIIVAVIFYMVFKTCTTNRHIDTDTMPSPYPQDSSQMGSDPGAPPPPYNSPDPPGFKREYAQGNTAPPPYPGSRTEYTQGTAGSSSMGSSTNTNSGFWSGAATGGLLGYFLGGRTRSDYYNSYNRGYGNSWGSPYHHTPHYGNTGGWFGNWFGGRNSYRPSHNSYGFSSFGRSSSSPSSSPSSGSRTTSGMGGTSRR